MACGIIPMKVSIYAYGKTGPIAYAGLTKEYGFKCHYHAAFTPFARDWVLPIRSYSVRGPGRLFDQGRCLHLFHVRPSPVDILENVCPDSLAYKSLTPPEQ